MSPKSDHGMCEEPEGSGDYDDFELKYAALPGSDLGRKAGLLLVLFGICLLLFPLVTCIQGMVEQRILEHRWQQAQAVAPRPADQQAAAPDHGQSEFPPTKIVIPRIGLEAVVVEGVSQSSLSKGPGHLPDTAWPGEVGNCCIAGHRNLYGSWFRGLDRLSPGDTIILRETDVQFTYRVTDSYVVLPADVRILDQTCDPTLTLITCTPVPRPSHRLVVLAELVGRRGSGSRAGS